MTPETPGHRLRRLLDRDGRPPIVLGMPSARMATIMERCGCEVGFVGTSITFGNYTALPDTGVASASECLLIGGWIARAVSFPVILDGDTGHGGPPAVQRLVRDAIREGLAGLRLDDQPIELKRRTQSSGIRVSDREDAVSRYRAAVAARDECDPSFVIMAQCYARDAENGGSQEALERLSLYETEGGVDWVQLEAPHSVEEITAARRMVKKHLSVMQGRLPRPLTFDQTRDLSLDAGWYTFVPNKMLLATGYEYTRAILTEGIEVWNAFSDEHADILARMREW